MGPNVGIYVAPTTNGVGAALGGVGDCVGGIVAANAVVVAVVLGLFVGKALGSDVGLVVSVFDKKEEGLGVGTVGP